jgi:predicted DNA-binding transcriptional regulator AlpA
MRMKITPAERKVFSVDEFCVTHGISRGTFYNLRQAGKAPAEMKIGKRTLVTAEAAEAWRRRMEAEQAKKKAG